jgi:hypothetical protein
LAAYQSPERTIIIIPEKQHDQEDNTPCWTSSRVERSSI